MSHGDDDVTTVTAHPATFELICRTCGEAKIRERLQRYPSGNYRSECRSRVSRKRQASKREWERRQRETDPEAVRLAERLRYQRERDVRLARARRYHRDHRKERCERSRQWRERNPDAVAEYQATYREMNRERINARARACREQSAQDAP